MKIVISQINTRIGNFEFNKQKIFDAVVWAKTQHADLVSFPHLAISGFPEDGTFLYSDFIETQKKILQNIADTSNNITTVLDFSTDHKNHIAILNGGKIYLQDTYSINNENIKFLTVQDPTVHHDAPLTLQMGASTFHYNKADERKAILQQNHGACTMYINAVGGQCGAIFDGGSMIYDKNGQLISELPYFEECYALFDTESMKVLALKTLSSNKPKMQQEHHERKIALIHDALVVGIRDFFEKQSIKQALIGLSGGIDSSIVTVLTVKALGKENVLTISLPSSFSTPHSISDAQQLVANLGCHYRNFPIKDIYTSVIYSFKEMFFNLPFDITEENIQARIRSVVLMAVSNKFGYLMLNTSNKSELAVGYGTLYGDSCGALSVLGDLYKKEVFALAHYINHERVMIPPHIITKAPSAELRPEQKDSDSLPDYNLLDAILLHHIEEHLGIEEIAALGFDKTLVTKIIKMVANNEYKRKQAPPVLKVSPLTLEERAVQAVNKFYATLKTEP